MNKTKLQILLLRKAKNKLAKINAKNQSLRKINKKRKIKAAVQFFEILINKQLIFFYEFDCKIKSIIQVLSFYYNYYSVTLKLISFNQIYTSFPK